MREREKGKEDATNAHMQVGEGRGGWAGVLTGSHRERDREGRGRCHIMRDS